MQSEQDNIDIDRNRDSGESRISNNNTDTNKDNDTKQYPWYYTVPGVLLLLFVLVGPFAIPFLIKSPHFGKKSKIFLTIAVILFAILMIAAAVIGTVLFLKFMRNYFEI